MPGPVPGLFVLGAGKDTAALPALLEAGFEDLLAKLSTEYDAIVVDAPPLALSDDARVLATNGKLLLWSRLGRTSQREARAAVRDLRATRADVVGCAALTVTPRLLARRASRRLR